MAKISATFITMFKEPLDAFLNSSIIGRAQRNGILSTRIVSLLESVGMNHHAIDDTPYGGGPGELMKIDVIAPIIDRAINDDFLVARDKKRIVLMDPAGTLFTQGEARRLADYSEIIFVCGRYEGIDARVHNYVDEAISVGDYVLSSGDLPAMIIFDAIARMIDGVLGNNDSIVEESHMAGRLEASNYTRPSVYDGHIVPDVLKSGHHRAIDKARRIESLCRTKMVRPDLVSKYPFTTEEERLLAERDEKSCYPWMKHE